MRKLSSFIRESNGNAEYNGASVGDIVEGLFACAITAAYIKKGKPIKESDILKVLREVVRSGNYQASYEIPDTRVKGIEDHLLCRIKVPSLAFEVLQKINQYKNKDLLKTNIKNISAFANTDRRTKLQATKFSSNGKSDRIEVIADGIGNQKGTKIDVFVLFNGQGTKGSVSLKARSDRIQNFDRGPVFDFDVHVGQLYANVIHLPTPNLKQEYDLIIKANKDASQNGTFTGRDDPALNAAKESVREAISMVSQQIAKDMNSAFSNQSYVMTILEMIQNASTRMDKTVSILDVSSMKRLRFGDKFLARLSEKEFRAEVLEGKRSGPDKVLIYADNELILQLRPMIQANVKKGKYRPRVIWTMETKKGIVKYASSKN